ncbi:MAG: phage tail tape measure protein, partial [Solobacterium sp.]|nr:phage tail tape measure protein [Solobacterium sp.]
AADSNTALTKIDEVGKTLENVGNKMSSVGSSLTRNVTMPIAALGTAAVKTTADFDAQMSKVSAISGATGKQFDALRDKARVMGAKTKFSATEAAQGFEYMAMAGWKTEDMLSGIEGIMNLAAASGEDLATTSDIVTDALTAFGLSAEDSSHFADLLASASSNANTNVSMLGESFKYAAPVAGALGISAEDTSLALGLMANAGIKATQAGTNLRTGLTNLAKPSKDMQTYMDKYSISLVKNADGSINLRDTMISLREKMGALSETEQAAAASAIFGKNSMAGWLAIINSSDQDFEKLSGAIDNCDGSAQRMAETMQDNLSGQITILKSELQELMIQIGDSLMPTIRSIVGRIQDFVLKLQQMDEGTRNTILRLAAFAAAIGPVLLVVGKLTAGIGKGMQAFSSMGKSILAFVNEAKLGVGAGGKFAAAIGGITAPVAAVIAVVAVLTAAFVHLWRTNEDFRNKVTAVWDSIKAKFSEASGKITEALNSLGFSFGDLGEAIKSAWDWFCNALEPLVVGVVRGIGHTLESAIDIVTGIIQTVTGIIKGFKDGDWSLFLDGLKSLWDGIWGLLSVPVKAVIDVIGGYLQMFGTSWSAIWTGIKTFFENVWNGISGFFSESWNGIRTTFETVWTAISNIVSSVWETIKNVVQVGVMFIAELFSAAFQILTLPFRFIWENCKGTVISAWESIKTVVGTAIDAVKVKLEQTWNLIWAVLSPILETIKSGITTAWDAVKLAVGTAVEAIRTSVTNVWNAIVAVLTPILEGIKTGVTNAWNTASTNVSNAMNTISTTVSNIWNTVKTNTGNAINGMKSTISSGLNAAKTTVSSIFDSIKTKISSVMTSAQNAVSSAISAIRSKFNFSWSLPHLKLPHISISGSFSINPPSAPHFSISWYKKAMENGMILNSPTIFGMKGNTLLAGGEAGSETVVGTQSLMEMIRDAVASMAGGTTINYGGVSINLYAQPNQDIRELADEIEYRINNNVMRRRAAYGT